MNIGMNARPETPKRRKMRSRTKATRFAPGGLYALAFGVPEGTAPEGAVEARDAAFAYARTAISIRHAADGANPFSVGCCKVLMWRAIR